MQKEDGLNLLDYLFILEKRKWMIASIIVFVTVFSAICTKFMTRLYKATAVITTVDSQKSSGLSALTSQLGGLVGLSGGSEQTGAKKIMAVLKSRSLAELVVHDLGLLPNSLEKDVKESARPNDTEAMASAVGGVLKRITLTENDKDATLVVSAEFDTPEMTVRVLDSYLKNLQKIINERAFTKDKTNRIFIEKQLVDNRENLLELGKQLNLFYQNRHVSDTESKGDVPINALRSKPEIGSDTPAEKYVTKVPQQVYLSYLAMQKGVLDQLNGLLSSQYEMAKIDEEKSALAFEVVDPPYMPRGPFKPNVKMIVGFSFVSAVLFALFLAFFLEFVLKLKEEASHKKASPKTRVAVNDREVSKKDEVGLGEGACENCL